MGITRRRPLRPPELRARGHRPAPQEVGAEFIFRPAYGAFRADECRG